ncbi:MAG: DNA polymerase IV [Betaproteobacteria bacterium]|nr:DNA polymerase IV [Betaproteobacteria bacterium]
MDASNRRIAHLDMDAFYASVELLRYPELRGQPMVVGGRRADQPGTAADGTRQFARLRDYRGRGVITTSTYEARALGVSSGMGLMKASRLAPDAILLPADFAAYRHYSGLFKAAVMTIAPQIEDRGIDEIYIDLTESPLDSLTLATRIKQAVRDATQLSCSIGITPNKLLSKICSDLEKPDGITILGMDDLPIRIWPMPVRKINGIGPKAAEKLAALGITTIGQLAAADSVFLQMHFGRSFGAWLHAAAHGIDDSPVVTHAEPKSISRETTFERDLHPRGDRLTLGEIFSDLCVRVAADLKNSGYVGRTIGIKLRFDDFQTVTRDVTLPAAVSDPAAIRRAAGGCLKRVPLARKLRLLGVRVSALQPADAWQTEEESPQQELALHGDDPA